MPEVLGTGLRGSAVKSGAPGPSVSVCFSDADPDGAWRIELACDTPDGRFAVGAIETIPSASAPPAARVVAEAYVPGAQCWYAWPTKIRGSADVQADLYLTVSDCCGAMAPGLAPVLPFARSLDRIEDLSAQVTSVLISNVPAVLLELVATNDPANADAVVQLYDLAAIPGDGVNTFAVPPVPLPAADTMSYSPNHGDTPQGKGRLFQVGIVAVSSLAYATKLEAGAPPLYFSWIIRKGG